MKSSSSFHLRKVPHILCSAVQVTHWSSVLSRLKTDSRSFFKRNHFNTSKSGCYYNTGFFSIDHFLLSLCVLGFVCQIPRSSTVFCFAKCFLHFCLNGHSFSLPDLSICLYSCHQSSRSLCRFCSAALAMLHRFLQPFVYPSLTLVISAPGLPLRSCPKESPAPGARCRPVLHSTVLFFRMLLW